MLVCLSSYVSHMEKHNTVLKHIFWVAIATLEVGDQSLYASAQILVQECVARLQESGIFDTHVGESAVCITVMVYCMHVVRCHGVLYTCTLSWCTMRMLYPVMVYCTHVVRCHGVLYACCTLSWCTVHMYAVMVYCTHVVRCHGVLYACCTLSWCTVRMLYPVIVDAVRSCDECPCTS